MYNDFNIIEKNVLTIWVDVIRQEEVELPNRDIDVVRVDTESRMQAVWGFL